MRPSHTWSDMDGRRPPDVRDRIQASRHFPHLSEVRVDVARDHVYMVPIGFGPDDVPALLLAGDRAGFGNRWYGANVPVADERFDMYLAALANSGGGGGEAAFPRDGIPTTPTNMSAARRLPTGWLGPLRPREQSSDALPTAKRLARSAAHVRSPK